MAVLDLKDAYYSVPVNTQHRKYPRFEFKGTFNEFTYLPNGLDSAPREFTKLMKPVYVTLRSKRISYNRLYRWHTVRAVFIWVSKVIRVLLWFCFTSLCDWLKNFAPLSPPIRSKTQTNRDLLARVFPRLAPVTCICFEFWLVHWVICVCCDWLGWLLWFWFYDTHLKSALIAETPDQLSQVVADTVAILRALGFTIHETKSATTPF